MSEVTLLLENGSDPGAQARLFEIVQAELRILAVAQLRHERGDHTLQPTALVNEAYLRLTGGEAPGWQSRAHFFGAASKAMRRILVDHARARMRLKRTPGAPSAPPPGPDPAIVLAIDEALDRLEALDARCARVVELRYFTGLTVPETAQTLGISEKTVNRDWDFARAWLEQQLGLPGNLE